MLLAWTIPWGIPYFVRRSAVCQTSSLFAATNAARFPFFLRHVHHGDGELGLAATRGHPEHGALVALEEQLPQTFVPLLLEVIEVEVLLACGSV